MGFADLYYNLDKRRNIAHFANIVRIAKSDGIISEEELAFLKVLAKRYAIDTDLYQMIVENPDDFPTMSSIELEERIERLYDLIRMVDADHHQNLQEIKVLKKVVTGLSFPVKKVDDIVSLALKIDIEQCTFEKFREKVFDLCHL